MLLANAAHYGKIEIDTKQVLEALRSLRAERAVNGHPDSELLMFPTASLVVD